MAIADDQTLMKPAFRAASDGEQRISSVVPRLEGMFQLPPEGGQELRPNATRGHFAITDRRRAGLAETPGPLDQGCFE